MGDNGAFLSVVSSVADFASFPVGRERSQILFLSLMFSPGLVRSYQHVLMAEGIRGALWKLSVAVDWVRLLDWKKRYLGEVDERLPAGSILYPIRASLDARAPEL